MTTLSKLSDLPDYPVRAVLVKNKAEAESIAAKSAESWYFEAGGKKPIHYLYIKQETIK